MALHGTNEERQSLVLQICKYFVVDIRQIDDRFVVEDRFQRVCDALRVQFNLVSSNGVVEGNIDSSDILDIDMNNAHHAKLTHNQPFSDESYPKRSRS